MTTAGMEVSDEMLGSMFEGQMRNSDCPRDVYGAKSFGSWDPVLHDWVEQPDCRAAPLFPGKYYSNKEAVLGLRCMKDVVLDVHPINGPFLHKSIEWALVHGIIAIVPDVDVYPVDETTITFNDKQETELIEEETQILRDWNADNIKEYKIVVLDRKHAMASTPQTIHDGRSVLHLHQLHNCKLIFLTSHRPKARYLWWTFFSSANIASWRLDSCEGDADRYRLNRGILTAVRYWGSTGPYCENGVLTSFADSVRAEITLIHDSLVGASDADFVLDHAALAILAARIVSTEWEGLREAIDSGSDEG